MTTTRRLTVNEAIGAYQKAGIKPIQSCWVHHIDDTLCGGCLATALYVASTGKEPNTYRQVHQWGEKQFGIQYLRGLIDGWDGHESLISNEARYVEGFKDGQLIKNQLLYQP